MKTRILATALIACAGMAGTARADSGGSGPIFQSVLDSAFQVRQFANLTLGESFIDIVNTGANGAALFGPGVGTNSGNICANIYAFDIGEDLISCCSCLITPNQVVSLRVNGDILAKPIHVFTGNSVTVKILATLAGSGGTSGNCAQSTIQAQNTGAPGSAGLIVNGMAAWGITLHQTSIFGPPPTTATTVGETAFVPATLSNAELASVTNRCTYIIGNWSTYGLCPAAACLQTSGALGATRM
jgi:hypothetical protein